MEQDITNHLRELFNSDAIVLHGSRAVGREREHSDWDFILIYSTESTLPSNGRLFWNNQNIEYSCHMFPVDDVLKEFGVKLQNARVVFENDDKGSQLLAVATEVYGKPLGWSKEDKESHSLWMLGRINGMRDCLDDALSFEKYAADFYTRMTNYWYWSIHDRFPKPIYLALDEIAEKDPEYFNYIERFVKEFDRIKKVEAAEEIYKRCFR